MFLIKIKKKLYKHKNLILKNIYFTFFLEYLIKFK